MKRQHPVYPVPWENSMRALHTLQDKNIKSEALWELSLHCLVRAWYGGYWRAAFGVTRYAARQVWRSFRVSMLIVVCRWQGLTEEQIEEIILEDDKRS